MNGEKKGADKGGADKEERVLKLGQPRDLSNPMGDIKNKQGGCTELMANMYSIPEKKSTQHKRDKE